MFPEQESFMDSRPGRCRTCAVVGNSINLLGSHYGAKIDFHDVVMRFNRARIVGYEEDVGNKTTLQLMYPESAVDLNNNTHLMFVPFKTLDLQWLVSAFTPHSIKQLTQCSVCTQVKVLHPGFIKYVHESWLEKHGGYPSTGFLGVVLAIHICDEVGRIRQSVVRQREFHILFMVLTTVVCYLLCWMPYGVVAMMATFGRPGLITPTASVVPSILAKSSTVINPLIYILMNKQFN
ncbi:hypothetical protein NHX12_014690 [Muraenolepis orangiensis]|uniref:G-protein coupled receptors family 1 profile domain-containing protein n=1 Tax=Muraenolepis orangiensis TaxID=630683 RepID=A0A9Q0D8K5_9TELE|nr:hypothetical protein NHX12_014690 [Muraenolepis orangiensis]